MQSACTRRQVLDDNIQFVDQNDEMEPIREKIRTEMDEYRRLKEMSIKSKSAKATTTTTTTTEAPTSTVRQVHLIGYEKDAEIAELPPEEVIDEEFEGEEEEATTKTVVDLTIIDAPLQCRAGFVLVGTRCRKLVR